MGLVNDFKAFLMRGNVVDLAVAVVLGVAFGALVTSLVEDLLTPVLALIFGEPDFSSLTFEISGTVFRYGPFINALIAFMMIAAAIFFFVIMPYNALLARMRSEPAPDPSLKKCSYCMNDVDVEATRCPFCTSELAAGAA
ncbi:MAG TPA: large conductance mechanosensitive channel protein MscL [Dehalococcoidia bacterium]|nr:large conductance mechanosensitive channel protein MscL [Dehalococcoidia bacterium]